MSKESEAMEKIISDTIRKTTEDAIKNQQQVIIDTVIKSLKQDISIYEERLNSVEAYAFNTASTVDYILEKLQKNNIVPEDALLMEELKAKANQLADAIKEKMESVENASPKNEQANAEDTD